LELPLPAPPVKSTEIELVGEGDTPFANEPVGLFEGRWNDDPEVLLWKMLLLLWLLLKLLGFFWREEGETEDPEANL